MRVPRSSRWSNSRRGSHIVETAVALPIAMMLTVGTCVGGIGIYRYQQVASLAREGARYASVHGTQYATDTGHTAATSTDIYNNAIVPMAVGLDLNSLNYSVTWNTTNSQYSYNPNSTPPGQPLYNNVTVIVTYTWTPQLYITGPITLSSTSTMPMSY
jgi:Flp pilus assembly protein TadG